jgi:hypothetical protein
LITVECDEASLVIGLVDRNLLDPVLADDPVAITLAAERALEIFCDGDASQHAAMVRDKIKISLLLRILRRKVRARPKAHRKA